MTCLSIARTCFLLFSGSLGGYIGMELLGREPDLFSCAVIASASQTVGIGAGAMAKVSLWAMKAALGGVSGSLVVGNMLKLVWKRETLRRDLLEETFVGPGMFFQHGKQHVVVLQQSNPVEALQNYHGPVLFVDGSNDHHDNREKLLEVTKANDPRSHEVVYEVRNPVCLCVDVRGLSVN